MQKGLVPFLAIVLAAIFTQQASAVVTTFELATLRNVGAVSISPSGRYTIYQVYQGNPHTNRYSNQWFLADTRTGQSRLLIPTGGDPILVYEDNTAETDYTDDWAFFNPVWASDQAFYYLRKDNGHITVHRCSLGGGDTTITGYVGNVFAFRAIDVGHAIISTWAPSAKTLAIHQEELKNGWLYYDGPTDLNIASDLDGMRAEDVAHYYSLDLASGSVKSVPASIDTAGEAPGTIPRPNGLTMVNITKSPDGKTRAFVGISGNPYVQTLYLLPNGAKQPVKVIPLHLSDAPDGLQWSPNSRSLYYEGETNHINADIYRVDIATRRVQRLTNAGSYLYNCSYNANVTLAACTIEQTTVPPNLALVDIRSGKVRTLTDLDPQFRRDVAGIRTRTLVWKNPSGDTLFGTLTYPRGYIPGKRYPLIFLTYWDQGFQRGGSGDEYPIFPLAETGFFVLNVDTSEASGYDPSKHAPGTVDLRHWQRPIDGMESIGRKLIAQGLVKPGFGIGGLSYGSELSMYAATHSMMFTAAIESHGGSFRDPFDYYFQGSSWDNIFTIWGLSGPPYGAAYKLWKQLSPALNADRTRAAILMNSNDHEWLPGLQQFWELRDRHKPVEFWVYHDEMHTKHQPEHRLSIYNRNVDWFNFWLQGKEDPNPAKREEYKRWENLRKLQAAQANR